jgi:hypothetical protein
VSGGIFTHNIEYLHHISPKWPTIILELIFGALGGIFTLVFVAIGKKILSLFKKTFLK